MTKLIDAGALRDNLTDIYGDEDRLVCLHEVLNLIDVQPDVTSIIEGQENFTTL